jgi:O-antigen/teichoic acid export membrane protein
MALPGQMKRLAKHSAIYGLGGIVSRILAVLLLPLYTRYLRPSDYGAIETLLALSAVLVTVLRLGISSAFFRFYFDADDDAGRTLVVRTCFWFTMASATVGLAAGLLLAGPISHLLFGTDGRAGLVRAAFVGLWAQMNYEQLTSLFRVEERSVGFVLATLANLLVTVAATVVLVVGFHRHAIGVIVGNFTGTLVVYLVLLGYRRYQLGLQFDRSLFRRMNRFGLPLVPSALALWAVNFIDRIFIVKLYGTHAEGLKEVGLYSIGVRIASAMVLLLTAFRTAWPAFAYSIEDDEEARRTYGYVLTYLVLVTSWLALALSLLSPWLVHLLTQPAYYASSRVVAPLAFAGVAFAGYVVMAIGVGRARRTQFNWVVTGLGAAVNVGLNIVLIPPYGMMGAAIATVAAYAVMFLGMIVNAQTVYRVPYQWRRVATASGAAVGLTVLGKLVHVPLLVAIVLSIAYPLVLLPLGFYLPAERRRLRSLIARGA